MNYAICVQVCSEIKWWLNDRCGADPKTAAKQNPFNFNNTQAQARTGTNTEASGLMELAEDASAVVGNLEDSEVPMVDGGKARGIRLTPSQVYFSHIYVD